MSSFDILALSFGKILWDLPISVSDCHPTPVRDPGSESFPDNRFQQLLKCRFSTQLIVVTANEHSYGFKVSGQTSTLLQRKVL